MPSDPVFVCGPPRSGTTWVAKTIASAPGSVYIHEPDNEKNNYLAFILKRNIPRFPYFNHKSANDNYKKLFSLAFQGRFIQSESYLNTILMKASGLNKNKIESIIANNIPLGDKLNFNQKNLIKLLSKKKRRGVKKTRIVKSVHAILSVPFLCSNFNLRVIIPLRHPASVISSYKKLGMHDAHRKIFDQQGILNDFLLPYSDAIKKINTQAGFFGLQAGIFHHILDSHINQHHYYFIKHEDLIVDPIESFREVFINLGLEWDNETANFLKSHEKEGQNGYDINRSKKKLMGSWEKNLNTKEIGQIESAYNILPNSFNYTF